MLNFLAYLMCLWAWSSVGILFPFFFLFFFERTIGRTFFFSSSEKKQKLILN